MSETTGNQAQPNSYRVPALEKGLDVLEFLSHSPQPMGLTDLADAIRRSKQEIFRVVTKLHERGYLVRNPAQQYQLSTKLFELGAGQTSLQTLVARAMPHMEQLAHQLDESCHLNIVTGQRMVVVAHANSQSDISLTVRVGASFSLHERNTGRVALAFLSEEEQARYWSKTHESQRRFKSWSKDLETIRHRGYLIAKSPIALSVTDCAAPILSAGGRVLGVLCVSHIDRIQDLVESTKIAAALLETTHAISAEFGTNQK